MNNDTNITLGETLIRVANSIFTRLRICDRLGEMNKQQAENYMVSRRMLLVYFYP